MLVYGLGARLPLVARRGELQRVSSRGHSASGLWSDSLQYQAEQTISPVFNAHLPIRFSCEWDRLTRQNEDGDHGDDNRSEPFNDEKPLPSGG